MTSIMERTYQLLSGHNMPILGLGTWELRGGRCESTVREALELGYRHIDTAELYGNEAEIGRAIKGTDRSQLFITSKVSNSNLRSENLAQACGASLDRLGTDYLDLYLVHWPNDKIPIENTMEAMQSLVAEGKVRSIGLSNFDVKRMKDAMSASKQPISNNQVEYHPYRPRKEIPQFCEEQGVTLTAYCPLARGKVLKDKTLKQIGRKYGKSQAQVSLRWLLQKGAVVIPKASSQEHLKANMDMDDWELSSEDIAAIDALTVEKKLVDTIYT